jgi:hypothetical protein
MIRVSALVLLAAATPTAAQEFSFRQECTLVLDACDMARDTGDGDCPRGFSVKTQFHAEGEAFYLSADGLGDDPADGAPQLFSLGQGYYTDAIRVYYFKDDPVIDGLFWIGADGNSGAHLSRNGLEDYFTAACVPLPD